MKPSLAAIVVATFAALFVMWVLGCSASNLSAAKPGSGVAPVPTPAIGAEVQQAGGINTQATGFNYNTSLPPGAVIIVCLSMLGFWFQSVLERWTSHRREMARIRGKQ